MFGAVQLVTQAAHAVGQLCQGDFVQEFALAVHFRCLERQPGVAFGVEAQVRQHRVDMEVGIVGAAGLVHEQSGGEAVGRARAFGTHQFATAVAHPGEAFHVSERLFNGLELQRADPLVPH